MCINNEVYVVGRDDNFQYSSHIVRFTNISSNCIALKHFSFWHFFILWCITNKRHSVSLFWGVAWSLGHALDIKSTHSAASLSKSPGCNRYSRYVIWWDRERSVTAFSCTCGEGQYACESGDMCIDYSQLCDETDDCPDADDEDGDYCPT